MSSEKGKIYKITNKENGLIYIGCTVNSLSHRFNQHLYRCFKTDYKSKLYNSMKKYGQDNFTIELLEECDLSIIYETEKKYIEQYDSYNNGLNSTFGGEGCLGYVHSPEMIEAIGSVDKVDSYIDRALTNKEKIMGFGHRVYKSDVDPRAKHLKNLSKQLCQISDMMNKHDISQKIETIMKAKKNLSPNVDFYSATVYSSMGIPRDLFTPIFAASRIAGWASHIIEQLENNRLIRPRAEYTGTKSNYVPIEKRS
jgi:group I intron endonuclease